MASELEEYVIKLGAQIDNSGIQRLFNLLDTSKMKALGITSALAAATTAVYKFVESATKQELELEKLARKQQKTIENVRATETALKAMGMTLKEIEQDKSLKNIYNDLVKFNKSLEMPEMKGTLERINNLRGAFWKLNSAVRFVTQWVNARILANLAGPLDKITTKLNEISGWIRNNLTSITSKISSFIVGFSKGVFGIFESIEKIVGYIDKLPDGIKMIGVAISAVFALIKSGPLGMIFAAITAIGSAIDDFDNYKKNKERGLNPGDEGYIRNLNDSLGIWDAWESSNESGLGKASMVASMIFNAIKEGIESVPADQLGTQLGGIITGIFTKLTEAMTGQGTEGNAFTAFGEMSKALVKGLFEFISVTVQSVDYGVVQEAIEAIIGKVFSFIAQGLTSISGITDTLAKGVQGAEGSGNFFTAFVEGILGGIGKGLEAFKSQDVLGSIQTIIDNVFTILVSGIAGISGITDTLSDDIGGREGQVTFVKDFVKGILDGIGNGIDRLSSREVIGNIKNIVTNLFKLLRLGIGDAVNLIAGEKNPETGKRENGVLQFGVEFARNIMNSITNGMKDLTANDEVLKDAKGILQDVMDLLRTALDSAVKLVFGEKDEKTGKFENGLLQFGAKFAKNLFKSIAKGAKELGQTDIGIQIGSIINSLFQQIGTFLSEGSEDFASLLGDGFLTVTTIAQSILDIILDGITTLSDGDGIATFVDGLFDFLDNAFTDLATKVQSGEIDLESIFGDIGTKIGKIVGGTIKLTADFLGSFVTSCLDWLANGGLDKLAIIGKEILKGILKGMGNIFDAIMESIFGEAWVNLKSDYAARQNTIKELGDLADENGIVHTETGDYTVPELIEEMGGYSNVDTFKKEKGLKSKTGYEMFQKGFMNFLGLGEFFTSAGGNTVDSSGTMSREQLAANILGIRYDPEAAMYYDKNNKMFNVTPDFTTLLSNVQGAENAEDFIVAISSLLDYLQKVGAETRSEEEIVQAIKSGVITVETSFSKAESAAQGVSSAFESVIESATTLAEVLSGLQLGEHKAFGGRIGEETSGLTLGEDGPEYIIPVSKPNRAFELINQMLHEMGGNAVGRVLEGFGLGNKGTLGESGAGGMGDLLSGSSGMNMYTVSAPVNITVNASGADGAVIGKTAYDLAESHLLQSLRGVFAS